MEFTLNFIAHITITLFLSSCIICMPPEVFKDTEANEDRSPRVIGGLNAQANEFPWMVLIRLANSPTGVRSKKFCGGVIISPNWIVTAARCSGNAVRNYRLTAAEQDADFPDMVNEQSRRPTQILIHPEYNPITFANDIALWKVFPPFILDGTRVKSIPYAHFNFFANGTGIVTGWGDRNNNDAKGPRALQKGTVQILSNTECQSAYDQAPGSSYVRIGDNEICTSWISGNPCRGDTGGPLLISRNGILLLAGIISRTGKCARNEPPRIYTRVSSFYDWIQVHTTQ